jgi:hypothetical protein
LVGCWTGRSAGFAPFGGSGIAEAEQPTQ